MGKTSNYVTGLLKFCIFDHCQMTVARPRAALHILMAFLVSFLKVVLNTVFGIEGGKK